MQNESVDVLNREKLEIEMLIKNKKVVNEHSQVLKLLHEEDEQIRQTNQLSKMKMNEE